MKAPKPSVMNMPLSATCRITLNFSTRTAATAMAATESQDTKVTPRSPRNTPSINSAKAASPKNISGSAGRKLGTTAAGILCSCPGLARGEMRRWREARGGRDALHHTLERGLHRPQERIRIDAHPQHDHDHRHEHHDLAPMQVDHLADVLAGDPLEDDAAVKPEHVGGAQDDAGGREEHHPGAGPAGLASLEGTHQRQELADEAAGARQSH